MERRRFLLTSLAGALAHERDRHRLGAHALARDAAGGVGGLVTGTVFGLAGLAVVLIVFFLRPRRDEEGWTVAIGYLSHPRRIRLTTFLLVVALLVGLFMAIDRFSKFWDGR